MRQIFVNTLDNEITRATTRARLYIWWSLLVVNYLSAMFVIIIILVRARALQLVLGGY